jgi:hypothetical protein
VSTCTDFEKGKGYTMGQNLKDIEDGLERLEKEHRSLAPKYEAAKKKFEDYEAKKIDIERDITALNISKEELLRQEGRFHDQMAADFSITKYGRNKRIVAGLEDHSSNYMVCECEVQCPECQKYAATLRYFKHKFTEAISSEPVPVYGSKKIGGFTYCKSCAEAKEVLVE